MKPGSWDLRNRNYSPLSELFDCCQERLRLPPVPFEPPFLDVVSPILDQFDAIRRLIVEQIRGRGGDEFRLGFEEMMVTLEPLRLRDATLADLKLLQQWDEKPHVIAAGGDDDWFDWEAELPRQLDWRQLLIAELADRPIGCVQIIDPLRE